MKEDLLRKSFNQSKYHPTSNLSSDIWRAINTRDTRNSRIKLWGYSAVTLASFAGLVFLLQDLFYQFTQSGFYEYLSLAFSDTGSVMLYWREFLSSISDSLPLVDLIPSFILLFIILISMRNITNQFKNQLITA